MTLYNAFCLSAREAVLKKVRPLPLILFCIFFQFLWGETLSGTETGVMPAEKKEATVEQEWGIEIKSIRLTANGNVIDFRYRVIDAEKASPLFSRKIKPYLINQESGVKLGVTEAPKIGALRHTRKPVAGKSYFIIFSNFGKYVNPGDKVTVVIGNFKAENLVVE